MTVFAGVRTPGGVEQLRQQGGSGIIPVHLDVTDVESTRRAVEAVGNVVLEAGLSGLVNNAGIAVTSPLECVALDALRRQLEVNVTGQIAVTQAFLPLLRRARGRIVNMGSINGLATVPLMGPYCASKYALEALTDALRLELRPWGINVSIIEAGAIATALWDNASKIAHEFPPSACMDEHGMYGEFVSRIHEALDRAARRGTPPDAVVQALLHALTAPRPKTRYLVGTDAKIRAFMRWLPDRVQDWLLANKMLKLPAFGSRLSGNHLHEVRATK
jgi:NAD(P)-dependent dehydrogenase (short-subunit alcohol dehydrogenase family)